MFSRMADVYCILFWIVSRQSLRHVLRQKTIYDQRFRWVPSLFEDPSWTQRLQPNQNEDWALMPSTEARHKATKLGEFMAQFSPGKNLPTEESMFGPFISQKNTDPKFCLQLGRYATTVPISLLSATNVRRDE